MLRGGKTFGFSLRSASPPAAAPGGLASACGAWLSATPPNDIYAPALPVSSSDGLSPCHSLALLRRLRPLPSRSRAAGPTCARLRRRPAMAPGACGRLRGPAGGQRHAGRAAAAAMADWVGGRAAVRASVPGTPTPPSPWALDRYICGYRLNRYDIH